MQIVDLMVLGQVGGQGPSGLIIMMALMFGVMWFLVINPQRKQLKQHKDLLSSLKKGDEVVTQGGMLGKIHAIDEKVITLEISSGVKIRVLKTSVNAKVAAEAEPTKASAGAEKKEEK